MLAAVSIAIIFILLVIGLVRPIWALALVMAMFPLEQCLQANSQFFVQRSTTTNLIVTGIASIGLIRLMATRQLVLRRWFNVVAVCTMLLYGYAALSYFWTFSPEWLAEYIRLALPFVVLIVFVSPLLLSGIDKVSELRNSLMVIGTVVSILLIINPNFRMVTGRYVLALDATTYSNPLAIGTLGGLLLLAAVLAPPVEGNRRLLVLRGAAFVAGLGLAFLSGSRGQVLFAIICAVAFYPVSRRLKSWGNFVGLIAGVAVVVIGVVAVRSLFVGVDNEARWTTEDIASLGEGRIENVADLATAYLNRPAFWPIGLGCLAFRGLPTTGGDPYSHVLIADLIFELGVPGVVLGLTIAVVSIWQGILLFRLVVDDPRRRADVSFLFALAMFEFMLANKAGQLWGQTGLFLGLSVLCRVSQLEQDRAVAAQNAPEEAPDDAPVDDHIPGRLVTT